MADKVHLNTDIKLLEMEAHLSAIYSEAQKGIDQKTDAYFKQFERLDEQKRALVKAGKLTDEEYRTWRKNKMLYSKRWGHLKKQLAEEFANTNRTALAYINGQLPEIYSMNYNGIGEDIESAVKGYSFEMVDADTIKSLAISDETLLPYKYLDGAKDVRWNTQKVNSAVLQGILQGESIPKLAKRLEGVTEMNRTSAIRNARTTVTSAECKGRQDGFVRAEADGIKLQREWIAAIDGRTRHAHRLLDGQLADVDKPFDSELGDIMYPGDPTADPANVYNCRCTIAARVISIGGVKVNDKLAKADRETAQDWWNKNPEELDIQQKMLYNKTADKEQYNKYKARLRGEAPRNFSDFQDMKYRFAEQYSDLKAYYRYKGRVPEATSADFEIAQKIKASGIVGTVRVPTLKIDVSTLEAVNEHAFRHGCTIEDAKKYIENAKVSLTRRRWDGLSINFYSEDGAVYVDMDTKKAKTIFSKDEYDSDTKKMLEAFK